MLKLERIEIIENQPLVESERGEAGKQLQEWIS